MNRIVILLLFPIVVATACGYSIGLSPDKLIFTKNEQNLFIFNPNNFDVNYSIMGCEYDFLELLRDGIIQNNSKREILVRYNPKTNNNITNCSCDIVFSNSLYSTGFAVQLYFHSKHQSQSDQNSLFIDLFHEQERKEQSKEINYVFILVVIAVFIISIFIILKFF